MADGSSSVSVGDCYMVNKEHGGKDTRHLTYYEYAECSGGCELGW